jgi:hypothetical protein
MLRRHPGWIASVVVLSAAACSPEIVPPTMGITGLAPSFAKPLPPPTGITVTVLPSAGAGRGIARAINDAEEIAGTSGGVPARWARVNGAWTVTRLGTTQGDAVDVTESGTVLSNAGGIVTLWRRDGSTVTVGAGAAYAMNESETVVVGSDGANDAVAWQLSGGVWTVHHLVGLDGVAGGGALSAYAVPFGISESDVMVGLAFGATGPQHAVKWTRSGTGGWNAAVPIDATAGATNSAAHAIDGDVVVGLIWRCANPDGNSPCTSREGWEWNLGGSPAAGSLDAAADAWPEGLNATRSMVGSMFTTGKRSSAWIRRPFVWSPSAPTLRDMGVPKGSSEGYATDINNATGSRTYRQAVGQATSTGSAASVAALWTIP